MEDKYRPRLSDLVREQVQDEIDISEMKKFGFLIGGVLAAIGALTFWRDHILAARLFGAVGLVLIYLAATRPAALAPFHKGWMKLAHALGWFNTRLILTVVFYLVLTPVGLLLRILRKRPLILHWDKDAPTYWQEREKKPFDPRQCEKHF